MTQGKNQQVLRDTQEEETGTEQALQDKMWKENNKTHREDKHPNNQPHQKDPPGIDLHGMLTANP